MVLKCLLDGANVGATVGVAVGFLVGSRVGLVGDGVGPLEIKLVGLEVGETP